LAVDIYNQTLGRPIKLKNGSTWSWEYLKRMCTGSISVHIHLSRRGRSYRRPQSAKDYGVCFIRFLAKFWSCIQTSQKGVKIHCNRYPPWASKSMTEKAPTFAEWRKKSGEDDMWRQGGVLSEFISVLVTGVYIKSKFTTTISMIVYNLRLVSGRIDTARMNKITYPVSIPVQIV